VTARGVTGGNAQAAGASVTKKARTLVTKSGVSSRKANQASDPKFRKAASVFIPFYCAVDGWLEIPWPTSRRPLRLTQQRHRDADAGLFACIIMLFCKVGCIPSKTLGLSLRGFPLRRKLEAINGPTCVFDKNFQRSAQVLAALKL